MFNNKYSIIKLLIKKRISLLLLLNLFVFSGIYSQNSVPNGSFEHVKTCCLSNIPNLFNNYFDTMLYNWSQTKFGGRPSNEIYNSCFYDTIYPLYQAATSTPSNSWGYQIPRSGNGYCGTCFGSWPYLHIPNYYNYIVWGEFSAVQLNQTLQQGVQYKARFNVSLADSCYFGTDAIGMHITADTLTFDSVAYMNLNLQVSKKGTGPVIDTGAWTPITGIFTASGGEQFLIIGSFASDSAMLKTHRSGFPGPIPQYPSSRSKYIYYYIDDVAIWEADTIPPCSMAGADTTICIGGKAKLGKHSYGDYYYEWFTKDSVFNNYSGLLQNGFMKYSNYLNLVGDSGFISVSPTQTTTYYCLATDFTYTKTLDSVTVYVNQCGQNDTTVCIEQAFIMGNSNNSNWNYKWSPPTFLNYDTVGQPHCSPMNNISYFLLITNSNNDTVSLDTVNIFVVNCYSAEAGLDTTLCLGDSIQLGSHNHSSCTYVWCPNQWLSDTTVGMPFTKPDTLIKYFLQVVDTLGNVSVDSILIGVIDCDTIGIAEIPKNKKQITIYPNPTSGVIIIEFEEILLQEGVIEIYDNIGRKVMETVLKQGENKYQITTKKLESGIYFYKLQAAQSYNGKIIISK